MKKWIQLLSVILCLIILFSFTGCKSWFAGQHEFLYKKMSEIPMEYDGYYLEPCVWNDEMCVTRGQHIPSYECVFRDGKIFVQRTEEDYTITYNNSDIIINQSFMEEKSAAYVSVNQIWVDKCNVSSPARIIGVGVYDEKIFIVTSSMNGGIDQNIRGECPNTLYYYDIDNGKVLYCGFYSGEITSGGLYDGFTGGIDFKVNKQNQK